MKKKQLITVCLLGFLSLPQLLNAQVNLSGNIGVNYVKSNDSKVLSYNITPKVGFQLNDNVLVGGLIGYNGFSLNYTDSYYDSFEYNESFGIVNIGVYSRIKTTGSEKIRLLIEPTLSLGIETDNSDLLISLMTVPVVQISITEKLYFDMTLGLFGLSLVSVPDADFFEFNFGINNSSNLLDIGFSEIAGSTLTPLQLGLTFSL